MDWFFFIYELCFVWFEESWSVGELAFSIKSVFFFLGKYQSKEQIFMLIDWLFKHLINLIIFSINFYVYFFLWVFQIRFSKKSIFNLQNYDFIFFKLQFHKLKPTNPKTETDSGKPQVAIAWPGEGLIWL